MKIREKLLALLLAIALIPTIVVAVFHHVSAQRLGKHLASDRKRILIEDAGLRFQALVDDYGRILNLTMEKVEMAVRIQVLEVERRLKGDVPEQRRLFYSEDYDKGVDLPRGMKASDIHFRSTSDDEKVPIQVTYKGQVYFKVTDVEQAAVEEEMLRLSTMPEVYQMLYQTNPVAIYWQYTSMESGFHTSYPGHGGYPEEYDPRKRQWYRHAVEEGDLVWEIMPEVSTRTVAMTAAMPVHHPDGTVAGVTAIDVSISRIFEGLELPEEWSEFVEKKIVAIGGPESEFKDKPLILAQDTYQKQGERWRDPLAMQYLSSLNEDELDSLIQDAANGKPGVRRMRYEGRDSMWAYGSGTDEKPFMVVIVPYSSIITEAVEAERYVVDRTMGQLRKTGIFLLAVIIVVAMISYRSARRVTSPVSRLAEAGRSLADGNYDARVDISSHDELQELGDIFNSTGPKLRESERMMQSLKLAREIQQHLLPDESPTLDGFDIAGNSVYCEETGGDYYDFLDLVELGEGKLGIALGDVSGHGISAALLMSSVRGLLRSHACQHGSNLGEIFEELNRHLVRDVGAGQFMTLFYGILDAPKRTLKWVSAGHGPSLWLQSDNGTVAQLPATGLPLGVMEEADYGASNSVVLAGSDVVLIGTDGIWEARNKAGEMFGQERMQKVLLSSSEKSAAGIYANTVDAVNEFRQSEPQEDDVTLVVIKAI